MSAQDRSVLAGDEPRSLPSAFLETARANWNRLALADFSGRELTFGRALVGALLFRRFVLGHCDAQEEKIGILLPPSVPAALLNLGLTLAGRVPVNLNYTTSHEALCAAGQRCRIQTIFTSEKLLERLAIPRSSGMVMVEDVARSFSAQDRWQTLAEARLTPRAWLRRRLLPPLSPDSLATVIFSSGSTGVPKGVMLSHRNILSNIEGMRTAIRVTGEDCLLGVLPFFHAFGFTVGLWLPLVAGFAAVYHPNPLEGRRVGELCRQYGATLLIGTPTFAWEYVRRTAAEDLRSLRLAIVGAEKMKPELARAFAEKFGHPLYEGYGCTELSPVVSVAAPGDLSPDRRQAGHKAGTVGKPLPGLEARVVDPATFQERGPGEEGLLLVRGASVMLGYLDEPEMTRQAIRDGWYVTGDVARLDEDGFITITDRLARFSKVGGEMVPHVRVEDALHEALGALEPKLVVTSLPDAQKGEKLVVLHTDLGISVNELLRRVRDTSLPKLWLPRRDNFFRVESLPILGSGKLDLREMRQTAERLASTAARAVTGQPAA